MSSISPYRIIFKRASFSTLHSSVANCPASSNIRCLSTFRDHRRFSSHPTCLTSISNSNNSLLLKNYVKPIKPRCFSSSSVQSNGVKTVQDVISQLTKKVGATKSFTDATIDRTFLKELLPKSQDELPTRTMADSYDEAIIPLGSDEKLREKYITLMGGVRIGRLLEDLDVFAVWICYNHVLNPKDKLDLPSPYSIVTGMVDRIDFDTKNVLKPDQDIKLSGCVSWTGRTSLEVVISVNQLFQSEWKQVTSAVFVMVARDPTNQGSAIVNKLVPTNDQEREMFEKGNLNKLNRKMIQQESLFKTPPNETEKTLVHNLFMSMADPEHSSYAPKNQPENSVWMETTKLKNMILCHPEHRNRFKKIFGGFLMRQAVEISWVCACTYSKQRPLTLTIDDIMFCSPVEIGSLLYLNSQVVYTDDHYMQISTKASTVDAVTGKSRLTNIFHFTYMVDSPVSQCIPRTYEEAMLYLDGRRRYQMALKGRKFYGQGENVSDTIM